MENELEFLKHLPHSAKVMPGSYEARTQYETLVPADKRSSFPYLTKFEQARIISVRSQELNAGMKPLISIETNLLSPVEIARKEFSQGLLQSKIERPVGKGRYEVFKLTELVRP
jgi:DNA-directed RNA polymerase I, II, and III subunit RPABC2